MGKDQENPEDGTCDNCESRVGNEYLGRLLLCEDCLETPWIAEIARLRTERDEWKRSEGDLSEAYLRLREILKAWKTPHGPSAEQVWSHTEDCARALQARVAALEGALRVAVHRGQSMYRGRGCPFCADRLVGGGCTDDCPRVMTLNPGATAPSPPEPDHRDVGRGGPPAPAGEGCATCGGRGTVRAQRETKIVWKTCPACVGGPRP